MSRISKRSPSAPRSRSKEIYPSTYYTKEIYPTNKSSSIQPKKYKPGQELKVFENSVQIKAFYVGESSMPGKIIVFTEDGYLKCVSDSMTHPFKV